MPAVKGSFKDRLIELDDIVAASKTERLRQHRQDILNRLVGYIRQSNGDDRWVYKYTIAYDWPAFCALELTSKEGIPLFLSPWQCEQDAKLDQSDDTLIIAARQVGKTTQAAAEYLKRMVRRRNRRVLHFAPTIDQLVVCDTLIPFIQNSDFITREYGASTQQLSASFESNGSTFDAINLNESGGNTDKKRGNNGTDIGIDEYQMMSQETWDKIVQPMLSNQLAGTRRVIKWGTVSTKYRPDFDKVMLNAESLGPLHFSRINCWSAVDQGIRSPMDGPGSMRQRFTDLNIGCNYVLQTGVCPRYLPHWFDELSDKVPARVIDKIEADEFRCNLVCMRSNAYLEEDMGLVGQSEGRYFPDRWLMALAKPYRFWTPTDIQKRHGTIVASADLGKLQDPTEIVLYEIFTGPNVANQQVKKLRVIGHETVEPYSKTGGEPSWDRTVAAIKRVNSVYRPTRWYIDTTRNDSIIRELTRGSQPLHKMSIVANEAAVKQETRGIWWSGEYKALMFENHQKAIADERIVVPDAKFEPAFFNLFLEDHKNVQKRTDSRATYTVFEDTGHLVDSMVMGSLALLDTGSNEPAYDFTFMTDNYEPVDLNHNVPSSYRDTYLGF